jgi:hypothetical protein
MTVEIPDSWPTPNMVQIGYDGIGSNAGNGGLYPWPIINPSLYWRIEIQYREVGTPWSNNTDGFFNGIGPCGGSHSFCVGDIFENMNMSNANYNYPTNQNNLSVYADKQYQMRFATTHAKNPQLSAADSVKAWSDWVYFDTTVVI